MRKLFALTVIALAAALLIVCLPAQSEQVRVYASGTVTDVYGHAIPNATVFLVDGFGNEAATATTNVNGVFEFSGVPSSTNTFKVRVLYVEAGNEYKTTNSQAKWYNAIGMVNVDPADTRLFEYPPPGDGFIWGFIKSEGGEFARVLDGTIYLNNGMYRFVSPLDQDSKGQYVFQVPAGQYDIYAVHSENGLKYVSNVFHVNVTPTRSISTVDPTILVVGADPVTPPTPSVTVTPVPSASPGVQVVISPVMLLISLVFGAALIAALYFAFKRAL